MLGEATFITQTSSRVSDQQLLSKIRRAVNLSDQTLLTEVVEEQAPKIRWRLTRACCHMMYNLRTRTCVRNGVAADVNEAITAVIPPPQILKKLHSMHGHDASIKIWREVAISLGK